MWYFLTARICPARRRFYLLLSIGMICLFCAKNPTGFEWRQEITAIQAKKVADNIASQWNSDAALISLSAPGPGSVMYEKPDGSQYMIVKSWVFFYRSKHGTLQISVQGNRQSTVTQGPLGKWANESIEIPAISIDSDSAIAIAVANGGVTFHPERGEFLLRMWTLKNTRIAAPVWVTPCQSARGRLYVRADNGECLTRKDLLSD